MLRQSFIRKLIAVTRKALPLQSYSSGLAQLPRTKFTTARTLISTTLAKRSFSINHQGDISMPKSTPAKQNKETYKRFIEEVFNQGKFDNLEKLIHPDYKLSNDNVQDSKGLDQIRRVVTAFRNAMPDFKIELKQVMAEGNTVMAHAITGGTHTGDALFGKEAKGVHATMNGLTMVRFAEDGRICESLVCNNASSFMRSLTPANTVNNNDSSSSQPAAKKRKSPEGDSTTSSQTTTASSNIGSTASMFTSSLPRPTAATASAASDAPNRSNGPR